MAVDMITSPSESEKMLNLFEIRAKCYDTEVKFFMTAESLFGPINSDVKS